MTDYLTRPGNPYDKGYFDEFKKKIVPRWIGGADLEYSIDGGPWKDHPSFLWMREKYTEVLLDENEDPVHDEADQQISVVPAEHETVEHLISGMRYMLIAYNHIEWRLNAVD